MRRLVFSLFLTATSAAYAADKLYQTGKFLDLDSEAYSKLVSNPSNGSSISVQRHENHLSVQIGDLIYVGECESGSIFSGCRPQSWIVGDPIQVRIDGDKMYLLKPKGGEVKTKIVKRVRAGV